LKQSRSSSLQFQNGRHLTKFSLLYMPGKLST